ncbi:MAG: lipid-A-disaccharide synthase [Endomicrobiales bacterium]|nr:lipid-A-disaccharide synthase [Endomicrobiales bacterium]
MAQNIFISAGDVSGEIHAANLVKSIKNLQPQSYITSLGGNNLKSVSNEFTANLINLSAFGFSEPLKQYSSLKNIFNKCTKDAWKYRKPNKLILVDYYGFNIHLAEEAHKRGIPVYYYISPQVWASRPGRIKKIAKYVKKMLVILPFEEEIYRKAGVDTVFVGHPLLDLVPETKGENGEIPERPVIGLFPGSRSYVIKRHISLLEKTAEIINKEMPSDFKFVCLKGSNLNFSSSLPVVFDEGYKERKNLTMSINVSGTVSLENALLGIPMVVIYKLSLFNYYLAKLLVKVPYITMVNLLAKSEVVPELIQDKATPENIARTALNILKNQSNFVKLKKQLVSFRKQLGEPGVSERAAKIILND